MKISWSNKFRNDVSETFLVWNRNLKLDVNLDNYNKYNTHVELPQPQILDLIEHFKYVIGNCNKEINPNDKVHILSYFIIKFFISTMIFLGINRFPY